MGGYFAPSSDSAAYALALAIPVTCCAASDISFTPSASSVDAYEFVEVAVHVSNPDAHNPFTDASVTGTFSAMGGGRKVNVDGFCDSSDGTLYKIRFMPPSAGDYAYTVNFQQGTLTKQFAGTFHAANGHRKGIIRVDPQDRWHFIWEGTGEHYFFNGTTAYWLLGWKDEPHHRLRLDRLHRLKVNRLRVTIVGRTNLFYGEPVMNGDNFTVFIAPWPAERATIFTTRFRLLALPRALLAEV